MKIIKEISDWILTIIISFMAVCILIIFVIQPSEVSGQSMEPSLHDGEKILINKTSRVLETEFEYGDIVVIDSRIERERKYEDDIFDIITGIANKLKNKEIDKIYYVKRVIGKPGDRLEYKDNTLFRNNVKLEEPYIKELMKCFPADGVNVPEGFIFVMGDNRNNSTDSREIGCIPIDHVLGKLLGK